MEYTVLGLTGLDYEPEEWTPVDSLAWLKAMAWDLRGNMDEEIARTRLSVDRTPSRSTSSTRATPTSGTPRSSTGPLLRAPTHRPGPRSGLVRSRRSTRCTAASRRSPT